MAYQLTIAEGAWSLTVNSVPVFTDQTHLVAQKNFPTRPSLKKAFLDNGYDEDDIQPASLDVFKQLQAAGFKYA